MRTRSAKCSGWSAPHVSFVVICLALLCGSNSPAALVVWQSTLFDATSSPVGFLQVEYDDEAGFTGFPGGVISDQTTFFFVTDALLNVDASVFTSSPAIPELENGLVLTDADRVEPAIAVIPVTGNLLLIEGPATAFGMADQALFTWTLNVVGGLDFFLNGSDFGLIGTDPITSDFIFQPLGTMSNFTPIPEVTSVRLAVGSVALGLLVAMFRWRCRQLLAVRVSQAAHR